MSVDVRMSTRIEQEASKFLVENEIPPGIPVMAEKLGEREKGTISLTTNVYGLTTDKNVTVYRYDVTISGIFEGSDKPVNLTRKVKNDAIFVGRREACRDVMAELGHQEDGKFFRRDRCFYYDLQSIFFSLDLLDITDSRTFEVPNKPSGFTKSLVELRPIAEDPGLNLADMTTISRNLLLMERSLQQFLDIATSQYAMFHPEEHVTFSANSTYLMNPRMYKLCDDLNFDDTCSYLAYGVQKAVHVIEGPAGTRSASLVVSTKRTPFHAYVNLGQKVEALLRDTSRISDADFRKLEAQLKGLCVETEHTKRIRRFEIRGLCRDRFDQKTIEVNGVTTTLEKYFQDRYNIKLRRPNLPLVEFLGKNKQSNYIPMELCTVSDNQRVKTIQQTPSMTQMTIRKCAVAPFYSREQNEYSATSLHLWDSKWLLQANINVMKDPVNLDARSLSPPDLEFADGRQRVNTTNYTWGGNNVRYSKPASCQIWACYAFLEPRDRLDFQLFERFLSWFGKDCAAKGMRMAEPTDWDILQANYSVIHDAFKLAAANGCEYILTVHSDTGDATHADIKYAEHRFGIVTQCVRLGTLRNLMTKNQRQTMSNIVNKANIKLSGMNYSFGMSPTVQDVLGQDILYIGLGMNHPAGGLGLSDGDDGAAGGKIGAENMTSTCDGTPSVVGFAANVGMNEEIDFVGDFFLQAPLRDEKANIVADIVKRCLEYYKKGRCQTPKRLLMYRNGCSEGQFRMVLVYEIPLIKKALEEYGCQNCKITIIVANRLQNIRFYNRQINSRDRPPEQNVKPGVVIDHTVVHPEFAEFYLNSHRALQGTARVPKYTVVYDENRFRLEDLENITFHLCFCHQIVYMPTSVPTPLYVANRYAERGRMLYQRFMEHEGKPMDYHTLTDKLCYYKNSLFGRRVNA